MIRTEEGCVVLTCDCHTRSDETKVMAKIVRGQLLIIARRSGEQHYFEMPLDQLLRATLVLTT